MDQVLYTEDSIVHNANPEPSFGLLADIIFEAGTKEDWEELHELHYKSTGNTFGNFYRCTLNNQLVGVCVMSYPRGLLASRHELFPHLKPKSGETPLTNKHRYIWLNENVSLNTRTVVDTMFRGIGIAYRLLNLAARKEGKRYIEIQSAMSRYNQFAQKAGFKFTKSRRSEHFQEGLNLIRMNFRSNPVDCLALISEWESWPLGKQTVVANKIKHFYFRHSSREQTGKARLTRHQREADMSFHDAIKKLHSLIFSMPLYGVYENPDANRTLPDRFPLIWFDRQPVNKPLIID